MNVAIDLIAPIEQPIHQNGLPTSYTFFLVPLTAIFEDLNFTQAKVLLLFAIIPDVNKLSRVSKAIIAEKNCLFGLKFSVKFRAGFVHGLISLQQLDNENGKFLVGAGRQGNGHGLHVDPVAAEVNLPPTLLARPRRKATCVGVGVYGQIRMVIPQSRRLKRRFSHSYIFTCKYGQA